MRDRYQDNHLARVLRAASAGRDNTVFASIAGTGQRVTYGDFFGEAEKVAAVLVDAGVGPGDRVAAQAEKSMEALALYVGTVLAGGVYLPLNTAYTAPEVAYFLGDAEPAVFVCDPARKAELAPVAGGAGVGAVLTLAAGGTGTLPDLVAVRTPGFAAVPRGAEDIAAILYTSGTTGRSKGAVLSHRALASNSLALCDIWRFTTDDVLIHALPIFHTHGLFVATNVALMSGCSLIFMPGFDAGRILAAMPRATAMMGVPTFYVRLLGSGGLTRNIAKNMRLFISGSAPLLADTHRAWEAATGHRILERYGMTETSMITSNPYDAERRAGTVGFPLPGVELKVTDPDTGAELPAGRPGGIEVRGPNLFSGYWRMPEKTAAEMRQDGFFMTGDIGVVDERGYVSIVGRAKDLIISGGYNVYPREIELLIDALPGVSESAVIGVPHPDFGEGVVAVVVPERGASPGADDISAAIAPHLARYKQPKRIVFTDALPRNAMGKVQKNQLRDAHALMFTDP